MSITDELRDWFKDRLFMANGWQEIHDIADRIDAEHERAMAAAAIITGVPITDENMAEHGWVRLPVDADGVTIRVGDTLDRYGETTVVRRLTLDDDGWFMTCENGLWYDVTAFTHRHAPTVEDVLREFAYGLGVPVADSYVAAAATKLRLAEGSE